MALSFVNIIVAQIWLIATIFGLLMPLTCPLVAVVSAVAAVSAVAVARRHVAVPLTAVALSSRQRSFACCDASSQTPGVVIIVKKKPDH